MDRLEGAGWRPRVDSTPSGGGRSGPPGSTATETVALPAQLVPLRDSEISELELQLTDDDLKSPGDLTEQAQLENAKRRLADRAYLAELAKTGFTGTMFEIALTELAAYGIPVLMAWMRTGKIIGKCKARGRPLSDPAPRWTPDDRLEIAIETTARALVFFTNEVLRPGKWDYRGGATMKTFFIGACLLQFTNVFEVWATEQRHWAQIDLGEEEILDDAVGRSDLEWADPTGDAAARVCAARDFLSSIPDPRTRRAAWLVFGHGASHAEAGAAVGLSAEAVEGRLYRLRIGGHNDHR
jgi:hypothetical protein